MRYGLIGTGYWAREVHATGLAAAPGEELVGVWGRDEVKRGEVAERFGIVAYDSPAALFADVDAVAFAVPPDVQAPLAIEAAEAGCHLLMEKPTALDPSQATAVADACERAGVASVVFFTLRFDEALADWLSSVRAQEGWEGVNATWVGNLFAEGSPYAQSPWRRSEGALWDLGPHSLSMALPIMGPVIDVVARRGRHDLVRVILTHEGGGTTALLLSHTVDGEATARGVEAFGTDGWSRMPDGGGAEQPFQAAVAALAEAAATGRAHPCDARFGALVVDLLARAEASAGPTGPA
ncbi:Gfo/Idh/MocA family oxidoreductase [soil metagenome]